VFTLKL